MIEKFDKSTALLLVDAQEGVNDVKYYGCLLYTSDAADE